MAPIWHPKDPAVLLSWVEAVLDEASDDLNDWETKFIDDMHTLLLKGRQLSEPQERSLERIYADKTN